MKFQNITRLLILYFETLKNNKEIHRRDLIKKVIEKYYSHLPFELLNEKIKSGDILIENRIAWGISYFKTSRIYRLIQKEDLLK